MKENIPHDQTLNESKNFPRVSLVIPFSPEMTKKTGLAEVLASAADKAEKNLLKKYSEEKVSPVIKKLRLLTEKVECSKDEKTLAIFVSPFAEKIYYFTPSNTRKIRLPVLVENNK
ncbi:MAG: hypothetical protein ABI267_07775 [Ginsengibacter sp.]